MFRILGFDVRVQSGFVVFMALIVVLYQNAFGVWLAGSIAVLTLVHELGHAVAARRTGAHAEISLGFLAGYASYRPSRELARREQAWISFAGPLVHIGSAAVVLLALGTNPLDPDSVTDSPATAAIWWAGPVIGAMNLIPILPLDGGNIAMYGLDAIVPGRAQRLMLWFSIGITVVAAAFLIGTGRSGFVLFIGFLLITQLQMLQAGRPRQRARSAWDVAADALESGRQGKARRTLVAALSHPQPTTPERDVDLRIDQLVELVELLPRPFPHGDPGNEYLLANVLLRLRRFDDAAHYAARSYSANPNSLSASQVARAAAALGDRVTAIGWLETAADAGTSPAGLAMIIDGAPELAALRHDPAVVAVRATLAAA
ncbi:MAG: hypothetical protein AB8G26_15840 [Ilumatobacter sp.]